MALGTDSSSQCIEWLIRSTQENDAQTLIRGGSYSLESVRARDPSLVTEAVLAKAAVLHVMGHGDRDVLAITSEDGTSHRLDELISWADGAGRITEVECLVMDACATFNADWASAVQSLLNPRQSLVFVGTSAAIDWGEATTFTALFYLSLLRQSPARTRAGRVRQYTDAVERAASAYWQVRGKQCPFYFDVLRG